MDERLQEQAMNARHTSLNAPAEEEAEEIQPQGRVSRVSRASRSSASSMSEDDVDDENDRKDRQMQYMQEKLAAEMEKEALAELKRKMEKKFKKVVVDNARYIVKLPLTMWGKFRCAQIPSREHLPAHACSLTTSH